MCDSIAHIVARRNVAKSTIPSSMVASTLFFFFSSLKPLCSKMPKKTKKYKTLRNEYYSCIKKMSHKLEKKKACHKHDTKQAISSN